MRSFARTAVLVLVALAPAVHAADVAAEEAVRGRARCASASCVRTSSVHAPKRRSHPCCSACARSPARTRTCRGCFRRAAMATTRCGRAPCLSADAFWQFGDALDRTLALRLFSALTSRFPSSALTLKVASQTKRLRTRSRRPSSTVARAAAADSAVERLRRPALRHCPPLSPASPVKCCPRSCASSSSSGRKCPSTTSGSRARLACFWISRTRAPWKHSRTRSFRSPDDVVKQVRVGRQPNSRTRVVLDLKGDAARYSVYTLYDPYRIVVDFERKRDRAGQQLEDRDRPARMRSHRRAKPPSHRQLKPRSHRPPSAPSHRPAQSRSHRQARGRSHRPRNQRSHRRLLRRLQPTRTAASHCRGSSVSAWRAS